MVQLHRPTKGFRGRNAYGLGTSADSCVDITFQFIRPGWLYINLCHPRAACPVAKAINDMERFRKRSNEAYSTEVY